MSDHFTDEEFQAMLSVEKLHFEHLRKDEETDCLLTLQQWMESIRSGAIIDDDGDGYWACRVGSRYVYSWDHSCWSGRPDWATHVVWFNK